MSVYIGTTSGGPSSAISLDLGALRDRVAAILQRSDLDSEIESWLNFSQAELFHEVDIPTARIGVETPLLPMPAAPVTAATDYYYYDLPPDFDKIDRIFFKDTTDTNNVWGQNLLPLPRKFYAGDIVDLERLMNVTAPSTGSPVYFWIENNRLGIYPALATGSTGKLQLWYYKIPPDMTASTDEPLLAKAYRHYLIWMAIYWGKSLLEQGSDAATAVRMWEAKFDRMIQRVGALLSKKETPIQQFALPDVGTEDADEVYN